MIYDVSWVYPNASMQEIDGDGIFGDAVMLMGWSWGNGISSQCLLTTFPNVIRVYKELLDGAFGCCLVIRWSEWALWIRYFWSAL